MPCKEVNPAALAVMIEADLAPDLPLGCGECGGRRRGERGVIGVEEAVDFDTLPPNVPAERELDGHGDRPRRADGELVHSAPLEQAANARTNTGRRCKIHQPPAAAVTSGAHCNAEAAVVHGGDCAIAPITGRLLARVVLTLAQRAATMRRMVPGETRNQATELRRGVLELCVLAVLQRDESYAFDLVRELSDAGELLTSEGTIYPLLARMREQRLVTTDWRESASGPPRRYYRLTDVGRRALVDLGADWARFRDAVDALLRSSGEVKGGDRRART